MKIPLALSLSPGQGSDPALAGLCLVTGKQSNDIKWVGDWGGDGAQG